MLEYTALVQEVRTKPKTVSFNLEMVHAGLVSTAEALKFQNAAQDPEIAHVLEHLLGPLVFEQVDWLAHCVDALDPTPVYPPRPAPDQREAA